MPIEAQYSELDIIVVGAGMVGLTAALAFHKTGFKVLVVDGREDDLLLLPKKLAQLNQQLDDLSSYDNRVSALTKASENIFSKLDVWPKILQMRASPYQQMQVWDGEGSGSINFSCAELYQQNLGHIVENSVALAALLATARAQKLPIVTGAKVTSLSDTESTQGFVLQQLGCEKTDQNGVLETLSLAAKLIVGADGAMSKIRQLAAIPLWQWDYGHHAIVATVKTSKSHQKTAWQRFTNDGPLAFLPLANSHFASIVWSTSPAHAKDLMAMDEPAFKRALAQAFEHRLGDIESVAKRAVFPLRQRHAQHYVKSGLALIGDAIHTIHPLAGQGVNLGLLDAAALAEILAIAKQRHQFIGSAALLKRYQRMRHTENLKMSATMQGFKWLFEPQNTAITIGRNLGMNLLNRSSVVKQHIIKQAMGLSGDLPALAKPENLIKI